MIKTLLDKNADASLRIMVSACVIAIAITLVYAVWRIQLANTQLRESRDYAIRRDLEIRPIVEEIRMGIKDHRRLIDRINSHLDKQDLDMARIVKAIGR